MREFDATVVCGGKPEVRRVHAADRREAERLLQSQAVQVLRVVAHARLGRRGGRFTLGLFVQELVALLEAGLALVEAIETLHEKASPGTDRQVLQRVLDTLYQGKPLSHGLAAQPEVFPALLVASVGSAEHTGQLAQALKRFHHFESRLDAVRRRTFSALLYPLIVMSAGGLILSFLLAFVIPRFAQVFDGMKNLNSSARAMVWWGGVVAAHGPLLLAGMVASLGSAGLALSTPAVRRRLWTLVWRVPRLAEQHRLFVLARFYRTLGLLLAGGMPALAALRMTGPLLPHDWQARLRQALLGVEQGRALAASLDASQLTTAVAARLLRVGERSGDLAGMCERIAQFHDEALERAIDTFSKVFEPMLMLAVGGIVGAVVFLLYMPIFELAGNIG
jgi:general secretion pathway protein F